MSRTLKSSGKSARAVTLNDVAEASGVSHQTVSRVINGSPQVAEATRTRVLAAVAELGYRPNTAARQLVTGTARTVGIISFGTSYYGPAQMVGSIERALKARGYGFVFASIETLSLADVRGALKDLERHQLAGLILVTPLLGVQLAEIQALCRNLPFVMIDIRKGAELPSVLFDQAYGSELATQHLLGLGHRAICEISGPLVWSGALERHHAWRRTVQRAGVSPGLSTEGDWTAAGGYRAVQKLLKSSPKLPFTALVVGNDQMALGAVAALRERGWQVPEDVSVVGFDDVPEARFYTPPLTTVRQDFEVLGRESSRFIVDLIEVPERPLGQRLLKPELVVRSSTAPPK